MASKSPVSNPSSPTTPHTQYESFADLHASPTSATATATEGRGRGDASGRHERRVYIPRVKGLQNGALSSSASPPWPRDSRTPSNGFTRSAPTRADEDMTTLDLVKLTIGLAGAQLTWTVEMAFGTPYLLSLGLSKESTSLVWLAGPLSGLLVQPIIGAISDSSQSRYRRRFFIAGSAVFVIISTLFVAYARELATLFSSLSGLGDWDPREEERIRSIAIVIGVTGFYVLDFSLNGLQASLRALILDQSPSHMQNVANAWHGRMTHIGNVLGYFAGYIDLAHWSGIKWVGGGQFRKLAVISCMFMAICVLVTCWTQVEDEALSDVVGTDSTGRRGTAVQWRKAWTNIRDTIKDLPVPVRRVCYVQFCAWTAWFPFLFYSTTYVAEVLYDSIPPHHRQPSADTATRAGSLALLLYAIVAFASGAVLPWISTLGRKQFVDRRLSRSSTFGRAVRRVLSIATPRNFWTMGLALYSIGMLCTFFVHSVAGAMTVIAFLGIPWSITSWVPFALVMESIRELASSDDSEPTSPITTAPDTPVSKSSPRSQPFRASLQHQPSLSGVSSPARNQVTSALTECSPLIGSTARQRDTGGGGSSYSTPARRRSSAATRPRKLDMDASSSNSAQAGGTILGIHNLAIVAPQFFVALVAAAIFALLKTKRDPSNGLVADDGGDDDAGDGLRGQNDVVWVLRFGGLASLVGVLVSRFVLPTRSELEYREFVLAEEDYEDQQDEQP